MHFSFGLVTLRYRKLALHQVEKCTTGERYDWYETKSLKRASMAVSLKKLTNMVDGSKLPTVISIYSIQK